MLTDIFSFRIIRVLYNQVIHVINQLWHQHANDCTERNFMAKYLYLEIKEYLLKLIKENKNITHYKLPSENQLALKFSTTRITAKRALTELQEAGYIYRIHGKGSFIAPSAASNEELQTGNFICMLLPDIESRFVTTLIDGVQGVLKNQGFHLLILRESEAELSGSKLISQMIDFGIKGIIVFPNSNARYNKDLLLLAFNRFPVVFVDRTLRDLEISSVTSDHRKMVKKAVELLFGHGCQNVGFISKPAEYSTSIAQRISGYEKAHIENNRTIRSGNVLYLSKEDPAQEIRILQFLEENKDIDGLLAYSGPMGFHLYRALQKADIRVPEQMEIIFIDDEYASFQDLLPFAPTCIAQRGTEIGRQAAQLILKYILEKNVTVEKIFVDCDIVERESTGS